MRIAGSQTRPPGTGLQQFPPGEMANSYLTAWNPDPLSIFSLNDDPGSLAFNFVIPLEYQLNDLVRQDFAYSDHSQGKIGPMTASFGGFLQLVRWPGQNFMEYFFPVFGISLLMCVLSTPALCSLGARCLAHPIRGSPDQTEVAKVVITTRSQDVVPTEMGWLGDVLV